MGAWSVTYVLNLKCSSPYSVIHSAIRNPHFPLVIHSAIRDPQSAIRNPHFPLVIHSAIRNPQSAFPHHVRHFDYL
jgi:catalase